MVVYSIEVLCQHPDPGTTYSWIRDARSNILAFFCLGIDSDIRNYRDRHYLLVGLR